MQQNFYYRQKVATSVLNNILKVPKNPIGGTCQISLPKWLEFTTGSPTIKNLKIAVFSAKSYTTYGKSIMRRNRKIWLSNKLHPKLFLIKCKRSKRLSTGTPQKCLDPSSLSFWDGTPRWFRGSTMTGSSWFSKFSFEDKWFCWFYCVFVLFLGDMLSKGKENYKSYGL